MSGILTEDGRLQDKLLPAVYFDSSVTIDYWMTEESMSPAPLLLADLDELHYQKYEYIKKLLKADVKLKKVAKIREKLNSGQAKVTAVISSLCLLEVAEWHAEASFKQAASEAVGIPLIERKNKKEIGDYLIKLFTSILDKMSPRDDEFTGEDKLFLETFPGVPSAEGGLKGLYTADIIDFCLSTHTVQYQTPILYAYAQLGATDIMHILLAQHLGCNYIASFDADFRRVREVINSTTGMELLGSPEEILGIL